MFSIGFSRFFFEKLFGSLDEKLLDLIIKLINVFVYFYIDRVCIYKIFFIGNIVYY